MKAHSLALSVAAVAGAFALFATPAEAGGCRKHHNHYNNNCYRGDWNRSGYYQPVRYYRPVRYVDAPYYYQRPAFQIGFVFGGNGGYCR